MLKCSSGSERRTFSPDKSRSRSFSTANSFDDAETQEKEARQSQLADYIVAQFQVMTAMCKGRSYNVIKKFEQELSYVSLISMSSNRLLPSQIRGQALELLAALYLDRYPQLALCGKASLPDIVWIYDGGIQDQGVCSAVFDEQLWKRKGRLRRKISGSFQASSRASFIGSFKGSNPANSGFDSSDLTANPNALPGFGFSAGHPFNKEKDPVLSMRVDTKFFLLREATNMILRGATDICIQERNKNALTTAAANVAQTMISFGFQSNIQKLKAGQNTFQISRLYV